MYLQKYELRYKNDIFSKDWTIERIEAPQTKFFSGMLPVSIEPTGRILHNTINDITVNVGQKITSVQSCAIKN